MKTDLPAARNQISTWTRKIFDPLLMGPGDVDIQDITHSLALQVRYNGHCFGHLSVARHSIWVMERLPQELKLEGLLHDAAEAYLGDLIRPLKHHTEVGTAYREAEVYVEGTIARAFNLVYPAPPEVREADQQVADLERGWARWSWDSPWRADATEFITWFNYLQPGRAT